MFSFLNKADTHTLMHYISNHVIDAHIQDCGIFSLQMSFMLALSWQGEAWEESHRTGGSAGVPPLPGTTAVP